jgi:GTP-binding protein EngB required for normal cell division
MNEVQKKLSRYLPKMAVQYVFKNAQLYGDMIVFDTQEEVEVAERLIYEVRRAMPDAKIVLRNTAIFHIEGIRTAKSTRR